MGKLEKSIQELIERYSVQRKKIEKEMNETNLVLIDQVATKNILNTVIKDLKKLIG